MPPASRDPEPTLVATLLGLVSVLGKVELDEGGSLCYRPSPAADPILIKEGLAQEVRNVFQ